MTFDIIIVGGGMVGMSLATALSDSPHKIALIDATPLDLVNDARLIALNERSVCLLKNLNVWDKLASHAEAIHAVHVSDRGHFGMTRLQAQDFGLQALGYVLPATFINAGLNELMSTQANLTIFRPATLKTLQQHAMHSEIIISSAKGEQTLAGKFIVGADGTNSTVRKALNIAAEEIDYQQSALVTITQLQRKHHNIAYERFHAHGAIAMLPLTRQRAATIWTDKTAIIENLLALTEDEFTKQLQQQFGYRLGRFLKTEQRHFYPLKMLKAAQCQTENVLLLGNAAHTFHPIAAQGLNLALAEIAMLSECLTQDLNTIDWTRYHAWQAERQGISGRLSHALPWLFSQDFLPLNCLRSLGMVGLDIFPALKRRFMRKAMGNSSLLPRLMQR
jgi:2-octaprenyl-6-methoxyphenol hydroxylase